MFLFALIVGSCWISGCAGIGTSSASTAPPAQAAAAQLTVTPSTVSVTTSVGSTGSQAVTATNSGKASVAINQVTVTGPGFTTSGLAVPVNLAAGQSQNFAVAFAATTPGTVTGSLSIMTSASSSPVVVQLSATAASASSTPTPTPPPAPTPPIAPPPTPSPTVTSVTISPTSATAAVSGTIPFTAVVQGTATNTAVTWTASSGTITSAGVYTAPAAAGSAIVTATSVADTTKSASAAVTVSASAPANPPVSSITLSPTSTSAITSGTVQFTATIKGSSSNTSVTWKASSGTITSAGLYTAPATAGTAAITATSVADTTKSASATVTVAVPVVNSVTISPASTSAITSGTVQFAATVKGTVSNTSVTWTASTGAISSSGLYTAPASAGTATVTATSVANTAKSASATVTISVPVVNSVTISPASASATTNGTLQFNAAVQGTVTDKSVTWQAARGTISSAGAYVAPSSTGSDTVTVTSVADTSKFATASVTVSAPVASGALPAFPSAQGGGAASAGGRGGQVIEVTNLNDSGDGSLRACLSASGPRTCVFRVAGIITPASTLKVNNPFVTIACQTAPGEIIIGGPQTDGEGLFIDTHDVVVRYCTFSADNINITAGPDTGTVNIEVANGDNYNIIFDHVTTRWAGNKLWLTLSNYVGPNRLITTQWTMFYEPSAGHPVGPGNSTNPGCTATSGSPCFSSGEHDIDFHHNLFADISHRIPESNNYSTRFVNNIVFNWDYYASEWLGAMNVDEIGNKYVAGNLNPNAQKHEIHFTSVSPPLPGNPSTYLSGNIGPNLSDPSGNQYLLAAEIDGENGNEEGAVPSSWIRSSPLPAPAFPINADSVSNLDNVLLGTVGNSQHVGCDGNWVSHRDSADQRIVSQYQSGGAGGFWPNGLTSGTTSLPTPKSGWTDQPVTGFGACTESLHDGIPDQWKSAQGLSTTDPNLYKTTAPNGYTYLENYMNGPQ